VLEGISMQEQVDEVTGLSRKVITISKDPNLRPRVSIKDTHGKTLKIPGTEREARYLLPVGANITVNEGQELEAGDIIAKIPRETTKTKDITVVCRASRSFSRHASPRKRPSSARSTAS
jgi:DNA-directed RNA polymerase subunit beta'